MRGAPRERGLGDNPKLAAGTRRPALGLLTVSDGCYRLKASGSRHKSRRQSRIRRSEFQRFQHGTCATPSRSPLSLDLFSDGERRHRV
jgi:hypothetical protein